MTIGQLFQEVFPDIQVTENGTCVWLNETEFPNHFTIDMEWWNTEIPTDIDELQNRATEEKLKAKEAELESVIEALKSDLDETLAVLSEKPEIVRCRECKYGCLMASGKVYMCESPEQNKKICVHVHKPDWFCANGEKGDG